MEHKVAFIDDSSRVLESIFWIFQDESFDIQLFQNPVEALHVLEKEEFAAIVADKNMPELDGTTLLQRVSERWSETMRIMMTAHSDSRTAIEAINKGNIYHFIIKPFTGGEIKEVVRSAVNNYREKLKNRTESEKIRKQNNELLYITQKLGKKIAAGKKRTIEKNEKWMELKDQLNFLQKSVRIGNALSNYVSLPTLQMIEGSQSGIGFHSEKVEASTILFSDIRGFTKMSEKRSPKKVYELLNKYLSKKIEIIEKHNGIIDKIIGDGIMAIFQGDGMAEKALNCGANIIKELSKKTFNNGVERISVGIGVNTGPVYYGSIGSESRKNYTVVGNTVNISSRLCQAANQGEVLFSEMTFNALQQTNCQFQFLGEKRFKGLSNSFKVFKLNH